MLKEIGSNFWLSPSKKPGTCFDSRIFNTDFDDFVLMSSGRNAISQVLNDINDKTKIAFLPSFTCESVIEPFIKKGYEIYFYSIDENLDINLNSFKSVFSTKKPSVVLFHSFFGFDTLDSIRPLLKNIATETIVIEDLTQSLYSGFDRLSADYLVGSFRKWAGIPDGGFAVKINGHFSAKPTKEDAEMVNKKIAAMRAKYEYLLEEKGDKNFFLELFSASEKMLSNEKELFKMSDFSILEQSKIDVNNLKSQRRNNFIYLLRHLKNAKIKPLFNTLSDDSVPLYFPVLCGKNRDTLQSSLRDNNIYAPIVWPKPQNILITLEGFAENLYSELLCIPIDQRYGEDDIEFVSKVLNSF